MAFDDSYSINMVSYATLLTTLDVKARSTAVPKRVNDTQDGIKAILRVHENKG